MKSIRYKEFFTGIFLASVIAYPWSSLFDIDPYTDVSTVSVVATEEGVEITANFFKKACTFKRLEVFGTDLGQTYNLDWVSITSSSESDHGSSHDRAIGEQTLRILIKTKGAPFDTFELRTRHVCDGVEVDRIFTKVEAP